MVEGAEQALEMCKQSANIPDTTPHHNERADRRKSGGLMPEYRLHDTPQHSQRGLVNGGSRVRVRSPALGFGFSKPLLCNLSFTQKRRCEQSANMTPFGLVLALDTVPAGSSSCEPARRAHESRAPGWSG